MNLIYYKVFIMIINCLYILYLQFIYYLRVQQCPIVLYPEEIIKTKCKQISDYFQNIHKNLILKKRTASTYRYTIFTCSDQYR